MATIVAGAGLAVGSAGGAWTPTTNLAQPGHVVYGAAHVEYDGGGNAYLVYVRLNGSNDELIFRERPPTGPWGPAQVVGAGSSSFIRDLALDVNDAGDVVIGFKKGAMGVVTRPAGGGFSAPTFWNSPGASGPASGCPNYIDVGIGDDGTAAVTWTTYQSCNGVVSNWRILAAALDAGGSWPATPEVWDASPQDVHTRPAVDVDDDGSVVVAFGARNATTNDELWTAERDGAGVWSTPVLRSAIGSSIMQNGPSVASDDGTTVVGWYRGSSSHAIVKESGAWSGASWLSGSAQPYSTGPAVAVADNGRVYVGTTVLAGSVLAVRVAERPAGGSFVEQQISRAGVTSIEPQFAANAAGDVAAVWDEYAGSGNQWNAVVALKSAGGSWPAVLAPVTTTVSNNHTLAQVAVDEFGHALAVAVPLNSSGQGVAVESVIESRDAATEPTTTPPSITPGVATVGTVLTCDPGAFGGTPPFVYGYEWRRDGEPIVGATSSVYTAVADDVLLGISCAVTATNEAGTAGALSGEVVVDPLLPANTTAPSITGIVEAGELVTCDPGTWSGAPVPELNFEWLRNGSLIPFENADSYVIDVADAGTSLVCRVTATNEAGSVVAAAVAAAVPAVQGPVNTVRPTILGPSPAALGDDLTCTSGTWWGAPTPTLSISWLRDGAVIPFEYTNSHVVSAADAGTTLTCQVTASNIVADVTRTSNNARPIQPAPVNTRLPSVGPAANNTWAVGKLAECKNGGWQYTQTFDYQWYRDGAPLAGVTAKQRVLTAEDAGSTLACEVTATGRGGSLTVMGTGRALASPPVATVAPVISGTPRPTFYIRCNRGTWQNATSFTYEWQRNGAPVGAAIRYLVQPADVGASMECRVTGRGPGGSTVAASNQVIIVP